MVQPLSRWPDAERIAFLVREAQRDVPGALDRLLATLRPPLVAFFSDRLSHELAEDSTQNELWRIARALRRIDPERADAYVATVARNLLRSAHRRGAIDGRRRADVALAGADVPARASQEIFPSVARQRTDESSRRI